MPAPGNTCTGPAPSQACSGPATVQCLESCGGCAEACTGPAPESLFGATDAGGLLEKIEAALNGGEVETVGSSGESTSRSDDSISLSFVQNWTRVMVS